ncbi:hypothetical protein Egran_06102 [Elaphomyces granulatus]|uniref:ribonuclease T1 n=1 Tax=Elaphomyces granulatus TaxID=519963 RepID=A0A232LQ48_9EURO|nr:hypothetical protein Egran_06102 [Elaphomyces granulatus]
MAVSYQPHGSALGNLTVYTPDDDEHIISMERFEALTKSITCDQSGVLMVFTDDATLQKAKQVWDWANGNDNRTFIIVAGAQQCGWNQDRQPFVINSVDFDEKATTGKLHGTPKNWTDIAHSYDFRLGHVVPANQSAMTHAKRDLSTIPFNNNLPFSVSASDSGVTTSLTCVTCGTEGSFTIDLIVSKWLFVPTGARLKVSPSGVRVDAKLQWSLAGALTQTLEKKFTPVSIPTPLSLDIAGVAKIGPTIDLIVGIVLQSLKAKAVVTGGAYATIPDSAYVEVNLLDPTDIQHSSWTPSIGHYPFEVDAEIQAQVEAYIAPSLALTASVLNVGYEVTLQLRLIDFTGTFVLEHSTSGVCGTSQTTGVSATLAFTAKLDVAGNPTGSSTENFDLQLGLLSVPLAAICLPFGSSSSPATTTTGSQLPSSRSNPPQSSGTTTSNDCTSKFGSGAACLSTSDCSSKGSGWTNIAGYCPGDSDIQCCYQSSSAPPPSSSAPPPSSTATNTCTVQSGVEGTCMDTATCSSKSGFYSEPGHCSGPSNIQCCYKPTSCTGMTGVCIPTSACASLHSTAVPNHCPGPADVQCCPPLASGSSTVATKPTTQTLSPSPTSAGPTGPTGAVTCGNRTYTPAQVVAARDEGCRHFRAGTTVGSGNNPYPHQYNNIEGFTTFRTPSPWYEFPMLVGGVLFTGASGQKPGPDRVVFDGSCAYAGSITHTGAVGNRFVGCSDTPGP